MMGTNLDIKNVKSILDSYLSEQENQKIRVKLHGSMFRAKGEFARGDHLKACYFKKEKIYGRTTKVEVTLFHDDIREILSKVNPNYNVDSYDLILDERHNPAEIIMQLSPKPELERKLHPYQGDK